MRKRQFILYDGRAIHGSTDDASVLVSCDSDEEAKNWKGGFGEMACYSYAIEGDRLTDEKLEWTYTEATK
jgi:hypothetical protein